MHKRSGKILTILQVCVAMLGMLMLALWPPATGRMLIVPIDGSDANSVLIRALAGNAQILGSGALPQSLVIVGDRSKIATHFDRWSVIILAPTPSGCGAPLTMDKA